MVPRALRSHTLAAAALACALSAAWATMGWHALAALRLPDTDDAMRLQQVRDWIAGQPFGDLAQHRLAEGVVLHWSRIGDLVPAGIILAARPLLGQATAELVAVIAWPLLQFVAFLLLVTALARRLAPASTGAALVLAALAYPATTLFLPGRIDHHALQVLLVLAQLRAILAVPTATAGAVAGGAIALGTTIGLETIPFACLTVAVAVVRRLRGEPARLAGLGLALAGGLAALAPFAGHGAGCDTVRQLLHAAVAGALALAALGGVGRHRLPLLLGAVAVVAALAWPSARPCLSGPYGAVDPLVARLWLANVEEAQPLLAAPPGNAIAYAGLMLAGLIASGALAWRRRGGWIVLLAYQAVALALTLAQLRGAYVGAALAVVPMAALIVEQRAARRLPAVLALWIAGAGPTYPIVAQLSARAAPGRAAASCTSPEALAALAALPAGRVMAPIDVGAFAIAATRHRMIAAPYHRNNAGNAAMYRFYLSPANQAARIARRWRIDYVVRCPGDLAEAGRPPPSSIAAGAVPRWLHVLTPPGAVPMIYAVDKRLSGADAAR